MDVPRDDEVECQEVPDEPPTSSVKSTLSKIGRGCTKTLKHMTPFFIVTVYSLIGAGAFIACERDNDLNRRLERQLEIERARNATTSLLLPLLIVDNESYVKDVIVQHEELLGLSHSTETVWNFWNAILYAGTIYTTIGYGNIACATVAGRVVTIFYAIVGIPLVLTTLNDLGKILLVIIDKTSKLITRCARCRLKSARKKRQSSASLEEGTKQEVVVLEETDAHGGDNSGEMSSEPADPPVLGAVIATISWLFICAAIFRLWEDWDYFTSFYFFFVSLSTIGFGDVVPAYPEYMVMNFALVLIGLALVTVCIAVVQQKLQDMYMSLLLSLLKEYQQMMEAGENEMGASLGMAQIWAKNKKAKWLMPLLSKDKRNMVMQKFHEEAKARNIELPVAFTSVDKKSGLPTIMKAAEKEKTENLAVKIEEELVQKTAPLQSQLTSAQSSDIIAPRPSLPDTRHMTSQTSLNAVAENEQQTYYSSINLNEATSQTTLCEKENRHMQTAMSLFHLTEDGSQTMIAAVEARAAQTLSSLSLQQERAAQTLIKQFSEQPMQTVSSYLYSNESGSQTLPTISHHVQAQTLSSSFQMINGASQTYQTFLGTRENLAQTNLLTLANCDSQTDVYAQISAESQTQLSTFRMSEGSMQTDKKSVKESLAQTEKKQMTETLAQTETKVLSESLSQTDYDQRMCSSQTDISSLSMVDSLSQTNLLLTTDFGLQQGSSLAELSDAALQASSELTESVSQTLYSAFQTQEDQSQTDIDAVETSSQTFIVEHEIESQTEEVDTKETDMQTPISYFKLHAAESQTVLVDTEEHGLQTVYEMEEDESQTYYETFDESLQTGSNLSELIHADSQTTLITDDAIAQTAMSYFDVEHFGSQTEMDYREFDEAQVQTHSSSFNVSDQCEQADLKQHAQKDAGVQTGILSRVEHLISQKGAASTSKEKEKQENVIVVRRRTLRKINKPNNSMALSDDESQGRRALHGDQSSSDEDKGFGKREKERLEWNPMDGRHVEKQKPVSALLKKFEKRGSQSQLEITRKKSLEARTSKQHHRQPQKPDSD